MINKEDYERISKELDECSSTNDCDECNNTSCPMLEKEYDDNILVL